MWLAPRTHHYLSLPDIFSCLHSQDFSSLNGYLCVPYVIMTYINTCDRGYFVSVKATFSKGWTTYTPSRIYVQLVHVSINTVCLSCYFVLWLFFLISKCVLHVFYSYWACTCLPHKTAFQISCLFCFLGLFSFLIKSDWMYVRELISPTGLLHLLILCFILRNPHADFHSGYTDVAINSV